MSDIPSFSYALLREARSISSVANLTRQDGIDFMQLIKKFHPEVTITSFSLENVNQALAVIRNGTLKRSTVLKM